MYKVKMQRGAAMLHSFISVITLVSAIYQKIGIQGRINKTQLSAGNANMF